MKKNTKGGRPKKSVELIYAEAVGVINLALALRQGRRAEVKRLHGTEATALRHVLKRRRGLISDLIGTDGAAAVAPTVNRTQRAIQLIVEHGMPVAVAARLFGINLRNLRREVAGGRADHAAREKRLADMASRMEVWDAVIAETMGYSPADTTPVK